MKIESTSKKRCKICGSILRQKMESKKPASEDYEIMYDLYSAAWYNRQITAIALYDALSTIEKYSSDDIDEKFKNPIEPERARKILRAKIYCEFIATLESLGILCIAIKKRKEISFAWSFSNTQPHEVKSFFNDLLNDKKKSFQKFFNFPTASKFESLIKENHANIDIGKYPKDEHDQIFIALKQLAKEYLNEDSQYIKLYNEFKHRFYMIDGAALEFRKVPKDKICAITDVNTNCIEFTTIPYTQESVDSEISNIIEATKCGAEIIAIALFAMKLENDLGIASKLQTEKTGE